MLKLKTNQIILLGLLIAVCFVSTSFAQEVTAGGGGGAGGGGSDVFGSVTEKAQEIFDNLKTLVFVLGGFGLIGFSVGAIFGKVQWKWFATLSFGLFVISVADQVVTYITADSDVHYTEGQSFASAFGDGGLKGLDFDGSGGSPEEDPEF